MFFPFPIPAQKAVHFQRCQSSITHSPGCSWHSSGRAVSVLCPRGAVAVPAAFKYSRHLQPGVSTCCALKEQPPAVLPGEPCPREGRVTSAQTVPRQCPESVQCPATAQPLPVSSAQPLPDQCPDSAQTVSSAQPLPRECLATVLTVSSQCPATVHLMPRECPVTAHPLPS